MWRPLALIVALVCSITPADEPPKNEKNVSPGTHIAQANGRESEDERGRRIREAIKEKEKMVLARQKELLLAIKRLKERIAELPADEKRKRQDLINAVSFLEKIYQETLPRVERGGTPKVPWRSAPDSWGLEHALVALDTADTFVRICHEILIGKKSVKDAILAVKDASVKGVSEFDDGRSGFHHAYYHRPEGEKPTAESFRQFLQTQARSKLDPLLKGFLDKPEEHEFSVSALSGGETGWSVELRGPRRKFWRRFDSLDSNLDIRLERDLRDDLMLAHYPIHPTANATARNYSSNSAAAYDAYERRAVTNFDDLLKKILEASKQQPAN